MLLSTKLVVANGLLLPLPAVVLERLLLIFVVVWEVGTVACIIDESTVWPPFLNTTLTMFPDVLVWVSPIALLLLSVIVVL